MRKSLSLSPLIAAFALSACLSFGADPPDQLLTLTPSTTVQPQTSQTAVASDAVTVIEPTVPQEIQTLRVPVRTGETTVAYVKDAQWVEMPASQFTRLLSETIGATTGRLVLDRKQFTFDPGVRLTGQLQAFGIDGDQMEAVVVYDAVLARDAGRIEKRRFEARVPVSAVENTSVGPALNEAANKVAAEVAAWIGA
jgi:cholesterol transport system auxiliary component